MDIKLLAKYARNESGNIDILIIDDTKDTDSLLAILTPAQALVLATTILTCLQHSDSVH